MGKNIMDTTLIETLNKVTPMVSQAVRIVEDINRNQSSVIKKDAAIMIVKALINLAGLQLGLPSNIVNTIYNAVSGMIDDTVKLYNDMDIFIKSGKK